MVGLDVLEFTLIEGVFAPGELIGEGDFGEAVVSEGLEYAFDDPPGSMLGTEADTGGVLSMGR